MAMAMATASTATAAMAASTDENRVVAFESPGASGESQYQEEHWDHRAQQDEAAAAAGAGEKQQYAARQSSLLPLTLEEIQNTMCEPNNNFVSMNMDEFLSDMWTAEEGTAMASGVGGGAGDASANGGGVVADHNEHSGGGGGVLDPPSNAGTRQASLYRQGSVFLPANQCRRTVDEVWSEIQRDQQRQQQPQHQQQHHPPPPPPQGHMQPQHNQTSADAPRQPTFGEMTLEDFLIKAGVVREGGYLSSSSPQRLSQFPLTTSPPQPTEQQQSQYGLLGPYPMVNERPGYGPIQMTMGYGDHQDPGPTANGVYHNYHQQQQQGGVGNGYGGGGVGYRGGDSGGGRMGNGHMGVGSPVSPVSSDGFGGSSQVDNGSGNRSGPWGAEAGGGSRAGGGGGARKRILAGPVDKVMERRQRRMIKNRESAARSRARKQAYTVELETELNHLKEENACLHEEQRIIAARRRQLLVEAMAERGRINSRKNAEALKHSSSCVW